MYNTMMAMARSIPIPAQRYEPTRTVMQYERRSCARRSLHMVLPTEAAVIMGTMGRSQAAVMVSVACLCCVNMMNGTPNAVRHERPAGGVENRERQRGEEAERAVTDGKIDRLSAAHRP